MDDNDLVTADDIYRAAEPILDDVDSLARLLVTVAVRMAQAGAYLAERRIEQTILECQMIDEGEGGKRLSVAEASRRATTALDGAVERAQAHFDGLRGLQEALAQRLAIMQAARK